MGVWLLGNAAFQLIVLQLMRKSDAWSLRGLARHAQCLWRSVLLLDGHRCGPRPARNSSRGGLRTGGSRHRGRDLGKAGGEGPDVAVSFGRAELRSGERPSGSLGQSLTHSTRAGWNRISDSSRPCHKVKRNTRRPAPGSIRSPIRRSAPHHMPESVAAPGSATMNKLVRPSPRARSTAPGADHPVLDQAGSGRLLQPAGRHPPGRLQCDSGPSLPSSSAGVLGGTRA